VATAVNAGAGLVSVYYAYTSTTPVLTPGTGYTIAVGTLVATQEVPSTSAP
jgi:hypothetical protein